MISTNSAFLSLLIIALPIPALAVCQGGQALPTYAEKEIVLASDALFFKTGNIELDIDGSPSAYGTHDQGFENICNGLGPLQPPECRGKNRHDCYAACQAAFRNWREQGNGQLQTLSQWMCSIGLGGGECSTPNVRVQASPRQDWFVSETSVHVVPPEGTSVVDWIKTQPSQLDPEVIPYFVIPGGFRGQPWDATPGDVGAVMDGPNGTPIPFIVGDVGGHLDEASARVLATLGGVQALPTVTKTSALGNPVERLQGAKNGDFRVVIFRHTAPLLPPQVRGHHLVLDKRATELPTWIRETVTAKLQEIGGAARIVACTAQ